MNKIREYNTRVRKGSFVSVINPGNRPHWLLRISELIIRNYRGISFNLPYPPREMALGGGRIVGGFSAEYYGKTNARNKINYTIAGSKSASRKRSKKEGKWLGVRGRSLKSSKNSKTLDRHSLFFLLVSFTLSFILRAVSRSSGRSWAILQGSHDPFATLIHRFIEF